MISVQLLRPSYITLLVLALAALMMAACGDDDDADPTDTTGATSTPLPTRAGQFPEDYPEDFPNYPNASLEQPVRFADQVIVVLSTPDDRNTVADFYRDALTEPWVLQSVQDSPTQDLLLLNFTHNEDPVRGSVTVNSDGAEGSVITLRFVVPNQAGPSLVPQTPNPDDTPPVQSPQ
jgi:hypothetical protein